jgi:phage baseplate assembly protein gpV
MRQFREWLHRRAGRYRAFWQPTFESDFRVRSMGTVTTSLIVASDDYLPHSAQRPHLAVEAAGVWYARTITDAVQLDADRVQLVLNSALNVAAERIARVSYLGLKRLDTDRVEMNWVGGGVCTVEMRLLELAP